MAISRLARFHAASYAMRQEHKMDFPSRYPFLATDPVYNAQTAELFAKTQSSIGTRLFNIFQQGSQNIKEFSTHFLDAVKNMHARYMNMRLMPKERVEKIEFGWLENERK